MFIMPLTMGSLREPRLVPVMRRPEPGPEMGNYIPPPYGVGDRCVNRGSSWSRAAPSRVQRGVIAFPNPAVLGCVNRASSRP